MSVYIPCISIVIFYLYNHIMTSMTIVIKKKIFKVIWGTTSTTSNYGYYVHITIFRKTLYLETYHKIVHPRENQLC
jgi:hypothetical protein